MRETFVEETFSSCHFLFNPFVPRVPKMKIRQSSFNPLVPRVQKIKIRKLALNQLLIVEFVKKMVYLAAHYSECGVS